MPTLCTCPALAFHCLKETCKSFSSSSICVHSDFTHAQSCLFQTDHILFFVFCASGNSIGLASALLISPNIVTTTQRLTTLVCDHNGPLDDLIWSLTCIYFTAIPQTWVYTIPAAVGAALAVVAFWWKRPPFPPSPSAQEKSQPFFRGVRKVVLCMSSGSKTIIQLFTLALCFTKYWFDWHSMYNNTSFEISTYNNVPFLFECFHD